ncbi:hypothetical protein ACFFRR_010379 [Megaselia abdita]
MGKNNKGAKKGGGISLSSKKDKNVFKVADSKGKKKPKEVKIQLKKLKETVKTKRETADAKLRNLHQSMVVKQPKSTQPQQKQAKPPKVNDKNVSQKLEQMKF